MKLGRYFVCVFVSSFIALTLAVCPVVAEESVASGKPDSVVTDQTPWTPQWRSQTDSVSKAGYSMVVGLGLCITVLFGGLALAKKCGWIKTPSRGSSMQIVEKLPLSAKSALCVVEIEGKKFLIAIGSERVSLVSRLGLDSPEVEEKLFEEYVCAQAQSLSAC